MMSNEPASNALGGSGTELRRWLGVALTPAVAALDACAAGARFDWPYSAAAAFDASLMAEFQRLLSISNAVPAT
ncbi:MAG TPA: hypothetical protein VKV26_21675 [Dehalococcoidia bacterium]|nr:hypothetical protein [Dehalococcoidia bacterium]